MAIIYSYPTINPVKSNDTIILTRCDSSTNLESKNYSASLSTLKAYINGGSISYGTGTTDTLPIWSDGPNGVLGDSLIRQSPSNPQIFISTDTAYVPSARLDIDGTTKTKKLNVSDGKFFVNVNPGFSYIQANNYGQGNYFTTAAAVNQPKYIPAFGDTGKIIESSRYKTIKVENINTSDGRLASGTVTGFTGTNSAPTSITLDLDYGVITIGDVIQVADNAFVPNILVDGITPNGGVSYTITFTGWPGGSGIQVFIGNVIQFFTEGFDGIEIIPSPGQGSFNFVEEVLFFYDNNGGQYNFSGATFDAFVVKYEDAPLGTAIDRQICICDKTKFSLNYNDDWYFNPTVNTINNLTEADDGQNRLFPFKNRAVLLKTNIQSATGTPVTYMRIKYCVLNDDYSWIFNSDQTIS